MNKQLIKMYYKLGIYNETDLYTFVESGDITENEKIEIQKTIVMVK